MTVISLTRPSRALLLGLVLTGYISVFGASAGVASDDPVAEAAEAFKTSATFPWYDADKDSLAPLALRTQPPPRESLDWLGFLRWVAWIALGIGLFLLLALIIYSIRYLRDTGPATEAVPGDVAVESAGVEALPFMAQRLQGDLLGEARRHYELGNYSEAIVYLFSYELVQLDRFGLVRLARGKTNRQYLRESGKSPSHQRLLDLTMRPFEDVFFGRRVLDRASFEACWQHVSRFENVAEAMPV
jgi:hypothetical protein